MTTIAWYHRDISRVLAEELLARAGRDGSFLVRDSESVPGAYALCVLFHRHVHTYRILPDADGLLAVQTTQGVQVNCFRTLADLVLRYQQPHKGLVTPLLYPVGPETETAEESSDGDDEKPAQGSVRSPASVSPPAAPAPPAGQPAPSAQTTAQQILLQRLQDITTPSVASEMVAMLSEYLHGDVTLDLESLRKGGSGLHFLQCVLSTTCHKLHSEIDQTMSSLETLAKVFDHPSYPLTCPKIQNMGRNHEENLETLLHKITALCNLLSSLEKRVLKALQEAVTNHNLSVQPAPAPEPASPVKHQTYTKPTPVHSFQVKVVRYGRQMVSVDVENGVLLFDKTVGSFGVETLTHDRILQLVKFQSSPAKLRMVVDNHHNPPRELLFESLKKREAFCQLLQLMKTTHSQQSEPDIISVFVGTWNMGSSPPPRALQSWMTCCGLGLTPDESISSLPHDIYTFGTQDNPQGEREWVEHIRATLRSVSQVDFKQVALQSLWNIRLAVFARPEHEGRISQVNTASVKTGLGNTLGNKGAVGISFLFNGTSMGFVNCHLTSGSEKALRRNQNFQDILRLLSLGDRQLGAVDISLRFTHLFWCGDLNYRLDLDVQDILKHVSKREFDELMCADQLTRERHKRKAFFSFKEEKITFPPTYRYERGSRDCYLWQKYKTSGVRVNGPSWCDRVLWKSYPDTYITCTSYGCTDDISTSDHSPVFATFHVGVTAQFPRQDSCSDRAWIELESVEAIVKTSSKAKFFIEFHSRCLGEPRRSTENDSQSCEVPGFLKLGWSSKQLPKLHPLVSDMEYLRDQHLLLSVKSCDGFESYGVYQLCWTCTHDCDGFVCGYGRFCAAGLFSGECCVALQTVISSSLESFETCLTHRGEEMGSIRGQVKVYVPPTRRRTRERVYEWICVEKDDKGSARSPWSSSPIRAPLSALNSAPVSAPISAPISQGPSVPRSVAPNSYTNPAYFIFEGVPMLRKVEDDPSPKESCAWIRDSAIQLPKVTGGHSHDRRAARRSDFTEIEIPGSLPPYAPPSDLSTQPTPQPASSYQLFPGPSPSNPSQNQKNSMSNPSIHSQIQRSSITQESGLNILPAKKLGQNAYMNHSVFARDVQRPPKEMVKKDFSRLHQERPVPARNGPKLYPYMSSRVPRSEASVPWVVEHPPAASTGDNSLTALQIAKSLSEVDFLPTEKKYPSSYRSIQPRHYGYDYALASEASYCWEKEVSVLRGAPETVRELLSTLGLQRYTQGLSLNGWDDLDYFSGITEEDLRASGVTNPSHRRRILENLPKIWD
ncbi:inositol polyphosphate phosphatase-like 1b isoform X2 [Astyanax mexicanus]|uniref:inositol polyphosphate phosphatase-like 1b isoform X2 n=1 Tax=Astyanax mexicanus TaxID=7994 RepID=UPI0020CB4DB6|nr:inositol polyphosphate phosphatase-like 1b isoform X2 [Astyanax mexicanus]